MGAVMIQQLKRELIDVYKATRQVNSDIANNKMNHTDAILVLSEAMCQLVKITNEVLEKLEQQDETTCT